jgi:PKD repeat protein
MWDFNNDGFIDSNQQNPLFTFQQVGVYSIALTITNGTMEDTVIKLNYITVTDTTSIINPLEQTQIKLFQNYPNPFNPSTTISFLLTNNTSNKELIIYNLKGQKVHEYSLLNNQSSIIWNGTDNLDKPVASGIYLYRLVCNNILIETKKMLLIK